MENNTRKEKWKITTGYDMWKITTGYDMWKITTGYDMWKITIGCKNGKLQRHTQRKMDREGVKSISTMRQGKAPLVKPAPPVGTMPGGALPKPTAAQLQTRTAAKQAYQSERVTYPGSNTAPDISNIVAERQGPLLAGRQARQKAVPPP